MKFRTFVTAHARCVGHLVALVLLLPLAGCKVQIERQPAGGDVRLTPIRSFVLNSGSDHAIQSEVRTELAAAPNGRDEATLTLENTGEEPANITGFIFLTGVSTFRMENNGAACVGELLAGASCEATVIFEPNPAHSGTISALLQIIAVGGGITQSFTGEVLAQVTSQEQPVEVEEEEQGRPDLVAVPLTFNFGNQVLHTASAYETIRMENRGTAAAQILDLPHTTGPYEVEGSCGASIAAGGFCELRVRFIPDSASRRNGTLVVDYEGGDIDARQAFAYLSGRGVNPPPVAIGPQWMVASQSLDFGEVTVGTSRVRNLSVTNVGDTPGDVGANLLSGTEYAVNTDDCQDLAPNYSCNLEIRYQPTTVHRPESVELEIPGPNGNDPLVTLSGGAYERLLIGFGPGAGPLVRALRPHDPRFFNADQTIYHPNSALSAGVFVASGDVTGGDGVRDTILSARAGDGRVFVYSGNDGGLNPAIAHSFRPYPGADASGVRLAAGDIDGDGKVEIITAPGPGIPGTIKIWREKNGSMQLISTNSQVNSFTPFPGDAGTHVAVGDLIPGNNKMEVIVAGTPGGNGSVQVYRFTGSNWALHKTFAPGALMGDRSIRIAAVDANHDGTDDIVLGSGPGVDALVQIRNGKNPGNLLRSFTPYAPSSDGVFVGVVDVDRNGQKDILTGCGANCENLVRAFNPLNGAEIPNFAFDVMFEGSVEAGAPRVGASVAGF